MKLHREMINNLKRGDKIITTGGLIGEVTKVKDNRELVVEISNNVEINLPPGMVHELYVSNNTPKSIDKPQLTKNQNDNRKGLLGGIFNKNKN